MILDDWTAETAGLPKPLSRAALEAWQDAQLAETIRHARAASPFYRTQPGWPAALPETRADLARLPFTTPDDLIAGDPPLAALSAAEFDRVVTLPTSGTTGAPKRVPFTAADIAATIAFFTAGMAVFTRPGDTVVVAFPGARPASIGDSLVAALTRLGAHPILAPASLPPDDLGRLIAGTRADVIAGPPVRILAAARCAAASGHVPPVRAVLVSSDHVPAILRPALAAIWGADVHDHWGMTETGLGGAVDCAHHAGMHLRETDLLAEIVDPATGTPLPDGHSGELVITMLRRRGLPLLRYRTGDRAILTSSPCHCGSVLKRLTIVGSRLSAGVSLKIGSLTLADLDDILFADPAVTDIKATLVRGTPDRLQIALAAVPGTEDCGLATRARARLSDAANLAPLLASGDLEIEVTPAGTTLFDHGGKRRLGLA